MKEEFSLVSPDFPRLIASALFCCVLSAVSEETRAKRAFCSFSYCLQIKLTDLVTVLETL